MLLVLWASSSRRVSFCLEPFPHVSASGLNLHSDNSKHNALILSADAKISGRLNSLGSQSSSSRVSSTPSNSLLLLQMEGVDIFVNSDIRSNSSCLVLTLHLDLAEPLFLEAPTPLFPCSTSKSLLTSITSVLGHHQCRQAKSPRQKFEGIKVLFELRFCGCPLPV